ncbi:MAG TPA: AAA family ATPase [Pirellula sp.]|nr:AAA family ATPase [Pirellula sp.]
MTYLRHWRLSRSPFAVGANSRGMFMGGTVEEAIARGEFLVEQGKRLGLVIGPSGVGKTTFLKYFCRKRNSRVPGENLAIVDLRCADRELLTDRILDVFPHCRFMNQVSRQDCWTSINDHLFAETAIGHRTVLLLDNVHDVHDDVYQAISQLWSSQNRWSMLLCVDDETIVNLPRWMIDQCELKIDLPSWDLLQTADYFEFAQNQAGGNGDIFNAQAITRIQELSDGIPRKIVQIAELALVAGSVRKSDRVTSELVDQVCDEFTVTIGGKFPIILEDQRLNAG